MCDGRLEQIRTNACVKYIQICYILAKRTFTSIYSVNNNATSTQNIQGVECQKKKLNGIIIKNYSLHYINTKPCCRELPKMQNIQVDI